LGKFIDFLFIFFFFTKSSSEKDSSSIHSVDKKVSDFVQECLREESGERADAAQSFLKLRSNHKGRNRGKTINKGKRLVC
jgi:hypothetical protein